MLIEFGAIILGLGILGALSLRAGISPIPLYLIGGLLFGAGGVVPLAAGDDLIKAGAEIGVILLLLTLGLEYNAAELFSSLRSNARGGLADLILNATPGVVMAVLLDWGPVAAIAMGGVTYVTSSGITAKVLSDLGWLGNRETPVVLSLLVFEDLAMAVYLPVLTAVLAGFSLAQGAISVATAVVLAGVVLTIALRRGHWIETIVASPNSEVLLLKVFGLALLVGGLAEQAHVSAAVGAFLVGIAVSGEIAEEAREVLRPLKDLFAAVFFVFFGLQTDPSAIPAVAVPAVILALVTIATKFAGAGYAARRAGIARMGRVRAGIAMIPRGEFSIVVAGLAVAGGANEAFGPLAATYVLILAAFGPLAARLVEPVLNGLIGRGFKITP